MVSITSTSTSLNDRLRFPFQQEEQWWEIWHQTERSIAAQLVNIPVGAISRILLKDPILETISDSSEKKEKDKVIKAFEIMGIEYLENVFTRTTGAQIVRSWFTLYNHDTKFRRCINAGEMLHGLTASAAAYDTEPLPLAEELKAGKFSPLHDFIFHAEDANQLISDFVTGEMEITPSNLAHLEQHMQALTELSAQPLQIAESLRQQNHNHTPDSRPSDYIREVIEAPYLTTPRQMQVFFSLLPPLITHGALGLSSVEYVPQDKRFLTPKQSIELAEVVEKTIAGKDYEYNRDAATGKKLIDTLPANAIVKKAEAGYAPLTPAEMLGLGNALHQHTKHIAGKDIDRVLAYADSHYEEIEQNILKAVYPSTPQKTSEAIAAQTSLSNPMLAAHWLSTDAPEHTRKTAVKSHSIESYLGAMWKSITRSESTQEMNKLYRRKLPKQILNAGLINVWGDAMLKTNGDLSELWSALKGDEFKDYFDKDGTGKPKLKKYNWDAQKKSELWKITSKPLADSHGLVAVKELASTGVQITDDALGRILTHLEAATKTGLQHDTTLAQHKQQLQQNLAHYRDTLPASLKMKVEQLQGTKPQHYTPQDYAALQEYFTQLSQQINQQSDAALTPFRKEAGEKLPDIIARNVLAPVEDVPSALTSISFIASVLRKEKKNLHSLEFVDPAKNLIPLKSFKPLAQFMEKQLRNAGLAVIGQPDSEGKPFHPEGEFKDGTLVQFNAETKHYEPASGTTLIRLANVLSDKFGKEIGSHTQRIIEGKIDKTHYAAVEKALFTSPTAEKEAAPKAANTTPLLSDATPWQAKRKMPKTRNLGETAQIAWQHATRPEAWHEASMLFNRTFFSRLTGIPIGVYQSVRRGYTEESATPVDGVKEVKFTLKASLTEKQWTSIGNTFKKNFASRGGLMQQCYNTLMFPVTEFIGTIGRELARYKVADAIIQTGEVSDTLLAIMQHGKALTENWEQEYLDHIGKSAALGEIAQQESMKMLPRIAMKPAHLRTEQDTALLAHYQQHMGNFILGSAAKLMQGSAKGLGASNTIAEILQRPPDSLPEAHETLGLIRAVMDASRQHLGVLRYVDPEKQLLTRNELVALSDTIETQTAAAQKSGEIDTEQGFLRLTNVIRDHFMLAVNPQKLAEFTQAKGAQGVGR